MREREGERGVTGLNISHSWSVMFGVSYLHVCNSGVRLMPSEMEYDIFAHADTESTLVIHRVRHNKRRERKGRVMGISTDWFIYFTAYFLCVFVRLDTANKAKPKDVCPALCEISLLSDEPALWNLPPLSGLLPNVVLVLVFVLRHLVCMFLFPFLPPLILTCLPASFFFSCIPKFLSFPIISTRIHL